MRTVRAVNSQKQLYTLLWKHNLSSDPHISFPRSSCQKLKVARLFCHADRLTLHSTRRCLSRTFATTTTGDSKEWSGPNSSSGDTGSKHGSSSGVYTVYDPISRRMVTRKGTKPYVVEQETESTAPSNPVDEVDSTGRIYGNVREPSRSKQGFSSGNVSGYRKKGKNKIVYVCSDCGFSDGQWWGHCRECRNVGTMKMFSVNEGIEGKVNGSQVSENLIRSWLPQSSAEPVPLRLTEVNRRINHADWRIPLPGTFGAEVARVLGGGVVPGSLVLVGGDPGVGKSTLLLQLASMIAEGCGNGQSAPVIYVSGEESVEQISDRADRMNIGTQDLFLYSSTEIEDILEKITPLSPRALIVDSIQTVYLKGVTGSAGGLIQVKECTSALLRFAKKTSIPVLLIGHVTKSGDIAGPRVLEHIVDTVLYMEGEKCSSHRLLRTVKNRFGSTDELGVFEMSQVGLQAVPNPSEIFLTEQDSNSEFLAGLAVAVIMDGSRSFLIEIQALCIASSISARQVNGVTSSRADMIISVLVKQAGLKLQQNAVFINVVSGLTLSETAGDLAIAAAICSSFMESPIPNNVAFIGEIGLGGELRSVPRMDKRLNTLGKLGYKKCVVPKSSEGMLVGLDIEQEMEIVGCRNLKEMINTIFT
ncbi:DNA repair protein RadA isoform X3 [Impatiens glandulifera]|nr:DNA repair protein RadA isoform X3 [Impatiens glandulifera]